MVARPKVGDVLGGYRLLEPVPDVIGAPFRLFAARHEERGIARVYVLPTESVKRSKIQFETPLAQLVALKHPGIVGVQAGGYDDDVVWIAVDHVESVSVWSLLAARQAPFSATDALLLARAAAEALRAARNAGFLHQRLTPRHIATETGVAECRIAEVGFIELFGPIGRDGTDVVYRAPEQLIPDSAIDQRVDIYGLGMVLWEMLSGRPPFDDPSGELQLHSLERRALSEVPPDIPGVLPEVNEALRSAMLSKRAEERAPSWEAMEGLLLVMLDACVQDRKRGDSAREAATVATLKAAPSPPQAAPVSSSAPPTPQSTPKALPTSTAAPAPTAAPAVLSPPLAPTEPRAAAAPTTPQASARAGHSAPSSEASAPSRDRLSAWESFLNFSTVLALCGLILILSVVVIFNPGPPPLLLSSGVLPLWDIFEACTAVRLRDASRMSPAASAPPELPECPPRKRAPLRSQPRDEPKPPPRTATKPRWETIYFPPPE